jgi:hypothetical protein
MNTVTYEQYNEEKAAFFAKHDNDFKVESKYGSESSSYLKTYVFEDGACWHELLRNVHEEAEFTHRGITFKSNVSLAQMEFWDSDNSKSRYYYSKW